MSRTDSGKFILPPLTVSAKKDRPYGPKFRRFDVPGEVDDLNEAMLAEDTRFEEVKKSYPTPERDAIALRVQQRIGEERREENRQLRERNQALEERTRVLEEENEELQMQVKLLEERENAMKTTYEHVVDRLVKTMVSVEARAIKDQHLDDQIKNLTSMLLQQSHESDPRKSSTPPSEPL